MGLEKHWLPNLVETHSEVEANTSDERLMAVRAIAGDETWAGPFEVYRGACCQLAADVAVPPLSPHMGVRISESQKW